MPGDSSHDDKDGRKRTMRTVQLKNVTLGEGRAKVIVPITGRDAEELVAQATELAKHELDVVEWRVDFFADALDPDAVLAVAEPVVAALGGKPVLFTFRTKGEGGEQAIEPAAYVELNTRLIASGLVDAVDVELYYDAEAGDAVIAAAHEHGVAVVGSNHDFAATPAADEIVRRLVAMQQRGCDVAKLAAMPTSQADLVTMLGATATMATEHADTPVLTMSMSGRGVITRIAAQVFGSCATFAMVGRASAPGQVPVEDIQPILALVDANLPR